MSSSGNSKTAKVRRDRIQVWSKVLMRELVLWQVWGSGAPSDLDSGIGGRCFTPSPFASLAKNRYRLMIPIARGSPSGRRRRRICDHCSGDGSRSHVGGMNGYNRVDRQSTLTRSSEYRSTERPPSLAGPSICTKHQQTPGRHATARDQAPVEFVPECTGYRSLPRTLGRSESTLLVLGGISTLLYTPDPHHQIPTPHTPRPSRNPGRLGRYYLRPAQWPVPLSSSSPLSLGVPSQAPSSSLSPNPSRSLHAPSILVALVSR
jgi:hypothetical protein